MLIYSNSVCILALTVFASLTASAPLENITRSQHDRRQVASINGCAGTGVPGDQRWQVNTALQDALTILTFIDYNAGFDQSTAYSHYFTHDDVDTVGIMRATLEQMNDPAPESGWQFSISCDPTGCKSNDLAFTDATKKLPGQIAQMRLCPAFFQLPHITSNGFVQNPSRGRNEWCQPGRKIADFETTAQTILHELTHLDIIGRLVSLPAEPNQATFGTEDVYTLNDPNYKYRNLNPQSAARQLKVNWINVPKDKEPILQRVQNAESYAAAYAEFYFQRRCNIDSIPS